MGLETGNPGRAGGFGSSGGPSKGTKGMGGNDFRSGGVLAAAPRPAAGAGIGRGVERGGVRPPPVGQQGAPTVPPPPAPPGPVVNTGTNTGGSSGAAGSSVPGTNTGTNTGARPPAAQDSFDQILPLLKQFGVVPGGGGPTDTARWLTGSFGKPVLQMLGQGGPLGLAGLGWLHQAANGGTDWQTLTGGPGMKFAAERPGWWATKARQLAQGFREVENPTDHFAVPAFFAGAPLARLGLNRAGWAAGAKRVADAVARVPAVGRVLGPLARFAGGAASGAGVLTGAAVDVFDMIRKGQLPGSAARMRDFDHAMRGYREMFGGSTAGRAAGTALGALTQSGMAPITSATYAATTPLEVADAMGSGGRQATARIEASIAEKARRLREESGWRTLKPGEQADLANWSRRKPAPGPVREFLTALWDGGAL